MFGWALFGIMKTSHWPYIRTSNCKWTAEFPSAGSWFRLPTCTETITVRLPVRRLQTKEVGESGLAENLWCLLAHVVMRQRLETASNITSGWQTAVAVGYWGDSQRTQPLLSLQRIRVPNKHHSQPGPCYTILKWSNMCTVDRCLAYAHHSLADWEGPQIWTQMHYWSPSHQQSSFAQTHLTQTRPQQLHV